MSAKAPRSKPPRKRRPSDGEDGDGEFDYELERPQKVPLLTAQEEAQRNLRLLADMRLTPVKASGVVDFDEADAQMSVHSNGHDNDELVNETLSGKNKASRKKAFGFIGNAEDTIGGHNNRDETVDVLSNGDDKRRVRKDSESSDVVANGDSSIGVPSNGTGLDINRPNAAGQFAFAFDFGEAELDLDTEIVESADVDFAPSAVDAEGAGGAAPARPRFAREAAGAAEFHPFCASTQPGLDFFAQRPDPDADPAGFLDAWRRERDFIKADVVRTAKRAASAKKAATPSRTKLPNRRQ